MSDLERIGRLLPALPAARRADAGAAAARAAWAEVAGSEVARHSHPIRMAGESLVVHCSSSTWASELSLLAPHILERLRSALGEACPTGLRFEVGELPPAAPPRVVRTPRPVLAPAAAARARAGAQGVAHERLRAPPERAL